MKRTLTGGLAVLILLAAGAPAVTALAQDRGRGQEGGERHDGDRRGGDAGALIGGIALGAALGSYAGRPYYCRNHHHWRWSNRQHRYVSVTSRGHYC